MIQKVYEITCEYCGQAFHGYTSIKATNAWYRELGGIVTADGKHFCDKMCYNNFRKGIEYTPDVRGTWVRK